MKEGRPGGIPSPCSCERWERLDWGSSNAHTVQRTNGEMVREGEWRGFGQSWYIKDSGNRSGGWLWKSSSSRALSSKWKGSICYTRKKKCRKKKRSNRCLFLRKKFSHIEGWENSFWFIYDWKWKSGSVSCSVMSNSLWPHGLYRPPPGQNTRVSSLFLLQRIFPTQGSNPVSRITGRFFTSWATGKLKNTRVGSQSLPQGISPIQQSNRGLLHCRWILYQLSYQGSPSTLC